jgi:MmyB-like transcription regulator ligand binding domain
MRRHSSLTCTSPPRYPDDRDTRSLVVELAAASPRFAELWQAPIAAPLSVGRKVFLRPGVGDIELDCDALRADGTDLVLVVYSASQGSPDAQALELLRVVGLQHLEARP